MKLSLSQNICKLRKSKHMTQERLAEALGVTFDALEQSISLLSQNTDPKINEVSTNKSLLTAWKEIIEKESAGGIE